ncbi:MAG: hypothetical protein ACREQ8_00195 [Woeseiaceae bacterium]
MLIGLLFLIAFPLSATPGALTLHSDMEQALNEEGSRRVEPSAIQTLALASVQALECPTFGVCWLAMAKLFAELQRRNVFRIGAAYLAVAWLLLQIVDVLKDILNLPEWVGPYSILALAAGFPVALALAWAFELIPATSPEATKRFGGRMIDFVIIGALSMVVRARLATLMEKDNQDRRKDLGIGIASSVAIGAALGFAQSRRSK